MRLGWRLVGLIGVGLVSSMGHAHAQELGVTTEVERPIARTGGDDPSASATEIDATERPRAMDTLEDAVREAPGTRTLSTGAYGSSTTLSLRGADASQTEVLFGEVPLTSADGAAFDLSSLPLWALDRVEVYRGGAPTFLGVSPVGGVLRLIPRSARGTAAEGTLGVGSFGLAHGRVGASVAGDVRWLATVGATTSEGDFPLLDDGRTAFDPSDDRERPRENGFVREGVGLTHLEVPLAGGRLRAVGFGLSRAGGVPGVASRPTQNTRRRETHLLAGLSWERTEDRQPVDDANWRVGVSASGAFRRREFSDLDAEIVSQPRDSEDDSVRALARVAASGRALDWLEVSGVGVYTHESLFASDRGEPSEPSARDAGTLGLEARMFGRLDDTRIDVRPSARLSAVGSRLSSLRRDRADNQSFELAPTFRLGAAVAPLPDVTISASAASATRLPSMVELFGDRGVLVGDPSLSPERAETFDVGVAVRGRHEALSGQAELRGFVTLASDLIRYARVDELRSVPENVAQAVLGGAELAVRGSLSRFFSLRGALTLLGTSTLTNGVERQLPLRPNVTAYVRPEVRVFDLGPLSRLSAFADLAYVSASFWDPANQGVLAERARVGAGMSLWVWQDRLRVDASVSDIADARGTDRLGFPLPGRSLWVSATLASR